MEFDLSLDDDMLPAAYRLSWPTPAPAPQAAAPAEPRPTLLDALLPGRRQRLHGWGIPLSAPAA